MTELLKYIKPGQQFIWRGTRYRRDGELRGGMISCRAVNHSGNVAISYDEQVTRFNPDKAA